MNNPTVKSVVQDIEYQEPSISEIETVGSKKNIVDYSKL